MARDISQSLESQYEPSHTETDDRAVIGETNCYLSTDPICGSSGEDDEMEF
ncbi:hypothetical protein [Halorussus salinus]|uniref:hypothetical protein n=1 Tax=Halorussus salinus TaxID=1364935 RepID=UPI00138ED5F8|nr:hypothetical protein [Halorussus salinus]